MITETIPDYLQVELEQSGPIPLDADFTCGRDELLVMVGPSGSGKTTILRAIAGLYRPQRSRITCAGKTWNDNQQDIQLPAQARRIGFVFQHYALFPHLTVARNISLACGDSARAHLDKKVTELLRLVNLEGLERRYPAQLSGGQQQRVALARALAREPAVLLLDEPFSAVDQVTRRKLRRELVLLRQKLQIAIILVTHDLDEARMLADRMCILHAGTLLQTGAPVDVLARPANAQVARLVDLGNVFSGTIDHHDSAANCSYLHWGELLLECPLREEFKPGSEVDWVIPPESVILHRRDRPSRGERENPVRGIVEQCIPLGENTTLNMHIPGQTTPLGFTIPTHVARRNNISDGIEIGVSLLADDIHLMPKP